MPEIAPTLEQATVSMPLGNEGLRAAYQPLCQEALESSLTPTQDPPNEAAISQLAESAARMTWWRRLPGELRNYNVQPPEPADDLQLAARHSVDFAYQGEPTGQGFTVFELTEQEEDRQVVDVVLGTLELIDQWSGGLLAAAPSRLNIVLNNGFRLFSNQYKNKDGTPRQNAGLAFPDMILINMPFLRDLVAEHEGMDLHNLVATTVVHEVLGHRVEGMVEGDLGKYFQKFFTYSKRGPGDSYTEIYQSITPDDKSITDSQPVREYGETGPVEDLATAIDAMIAEVMGWELTNRNSPRFRNQRDPYRFELAMNLLKLGAEKAKSDKNGVNRGVPGYVGGEREIIGEDTDDARFQRARTMQVTPSYGQDALHQELTAIVTTALARRSQPMARGDFVEEPMTREICF